MDIDGEIRRERDRIRAQKEEQERLRREERARFVPAVANLRPHGVEWYRTLERHKARVKRIKYERQPFWQPTRHILGIEESDHDDDGIMLWAFSVYIRHDGLVGASQNFDSLDTAVDTFMTWNESHNGRSPITVGDGDVLYWRDKIYTDVAQRWVINRSV